MEEEIERVNSERLKVLSQLYDNNKEMERIKAESKRIKAESKRIKSLESKEEMKRLNAESKCLEQERDRLNSIYEHLSSWTKPSKEINPTYPTISVATLIDMINSEAAFERNMENLKNMATMSSVGTFGAPNSHSINKQLVPSSNKRLKVSATAKELHFNKDESAIRKLQLQAQDLIDEGAKVVAAGANPLLIARSVEKQTEALVNEFKAMSKERKTYGERQEEGTGEETLRD